MNWYAQLRVLGLARRAVRALERGADALDLLATAAAKPERPVPKPTVFTTLDLDAANEQWRKDRQAAMEDDDGAA